MAQFFSIHPENPQGRLIKQAVEIVARGGVVAYPTDSAYALACRLENKDGLERIVRIRDMDRDHNFTLVCPDLSVLATYARVDNTVFRALKSHTPGPFTFILPATREVPKRLMHPKRRTIGLRVPSNPIAQALLAELGEPLMSCSLVLPGQSGPETDPWNIRELLEHAVDLVIDGGFCGLEPSTVVDFTGIEPALLRQGLGDASAIVEGP